MTTDQQQLARRITRTLFMAQSLGSAGIIATVTLNAILGVQLGGSTAWAGVPGAVYLLGSASAALLWGNLVARRGWRLGLISGTACGVVGAAIAFSGVAGSIFPLFLAGLLIMGTANSAMQLSRFASAEVHPPGERGQAISSVVLGSTIGAIAGPLLISPAGVLVVSAGLDELAGAYLASLLLFTLAGLLHFFWLRPEPRLLGQEIARQFPAQGSHGQPARSPLQILRQPAAALALASMVLGQLVMVMVMAMTSLHMRNHQHGLGAISMVISAHTVGMYAFSLLSGRLADRFGRLPVILVGAVTLLLACLAAPLSPDFLPLALALFLLGLGWNFCFVGGSALLADQLSPAERARTQGTNDLLVGLASMLASLGSGLAFAALGFTSMALGGAAIAALLLLFTVTTSRSPQPGALP